LQDTGMTQPAFSPSAEQNKQPILVKLLQLLAAQGAALEIASGTGQHAAWFASHLPQWRWQPSEAQIEAAHDIALHATLAGASNVLPALQLDVCANPWLPARPDAAEPTRFDLIFCANMLHIAPWAACVGLMRGSAQHLAPGGMLVTYGPYLEKEVVTTQSNLDFDASLRQRDAAWGIRWREEIESEAQRAGLRLSQRHTMPANNLLLVWVHTEA
jgi:hypothetical protein